MSATRLAGLPAVARGDARILVLGSMPGTASLAAQRYYAHPRNAFSPIMGALAGAAPELPYPQRLARLAGAGIALWDVLAHCERAGSLDARIEPGSIVVNDFDAFFAAHPHVALVAFNGGTAARVFARHAANALRPGTATVTLPSTSPAYAAMPLAGKLAAWRAALEPLVRSRYGSA
ncbi:DNA-deoxyinosine glycosylase [Luteimonas yindakuii]|uniref:DNA-deoxyinosine glycosylase n=1 Tax=Luteimonas yindakuii TaxID=2565782 RepID=UPI0011078517|nr:DNA-deoxyinosine glycosylase [Luteimonas yindakuii]QCU72479.1 DNA-deoxyinosine glycosylase [Luteimonas yindakuii]